MKIWPKIMVAWNSNSTAHERRKSQAFKAGFWSLIAKSVNILSGLITVPLTISYLGGEKFGLWMFASGIVGFLAFSDFGLALSLQNLLSKADGEKDIEKPVTFVSTAFVFLLLVVVLLNIFSFFIIPSLNIVQIFEKNTALTNSLYVLAIQFALFSFSLGIFAGLTRAILVGYQGGAIYNKLLLLGRILAFIWVIICYQFKLPVYWLIGGFIGLPNVVLISALPKIFQDKPYLKPKISKLSLTNLKIQFSSGLEFSLVQVGYMLMVNGPVLVLTKTAGLEAVAVFSVVQRYFSAGFMGLSVFVSQLWPAFGEACASGDFDWIKKVLMRIAKVLFPFSFVLGVTMAFLGPSMISFWIDSKLQVNPSIIWILAIWAILLSYQEAFATFLGGINHVRAVGIYSLILSSLPILILLNWGQGIEITLLTFLFFGGFLRVVFLCLDSTYRYRKLLRGANVG
jgi:O-antigen/teichoic acid export membrane protein